jgi:hypothetical protein
MGISSSLWKLMHDKVGRFRAVFLEHMSATKLEGWIWIYWIWNERTWWNQECWEWTFSLPPPVTLSTSVYHAQEYVKFVICSMFPCAFNSDAGLDRMWQDRQAVDKCISFIFWKCISRIYQGATWCMRANWFKRKLATRYYIKLRLIPRSWWSSNALNRVFNLIIQGGAGRSAFFFKKNSAFILSLFSFRFLTLVSCVFGQTARACTHPHEPGLAWGNALVIHSAARFSRSTIPRPDRTVDLSSFQTVRFERKQPGTWKDWPRDSAPCHAHAPVNKPCNSSCTFSCCGGRKHIGRCNRTDYVVCVEVHDHNLIDFHVHVLFAPLCSGKLYFFLSSILFLLRLQSNLVGVFCAILRVFCAISPASHLVHRQQLC